MRSQQHGAKLVVTMLAGLVASGASLAQTAPATEAGFQQRVLALELALATIVSEPTRGWRLDAVAAEAAELVQIAPTPPDRLATQRIADRIERFRTIADGNTLSSPPAPPERSLADSWRAPTMPRSEPSPQAATSPAKPATAPNGLTRSATGAAQGVLRPVVSKRPDAPPYAIVGDDGRVAAFITPKPELRAKLDELVGERVALDGQQVYRASARGRAMVADRGEPIRRR